MSASLLAMLLLASPGTRYDAGSRASHLEAALQAVRHAKPEILDKAQVYVSAMERGACASDNQRLRADCLIAASKRYCKSGGRSEGKRCPLFMDVIASNVLAEKELVSVGERYEMMRRSKDPRREMARRLSRTYGALAVELRLSSQDNAKKSLGEEIDRFCLSNADRSSLSWQTCSAGLVWFIGRKG